MLERRPARSAGTPGRAGPGLAGPGTSTSTKSTHFPV